MRNNETSFYKEDTSPVIINVLFLGKEGLKGIKRIAEHTLVETITEVVIAIHLKKERDLNFE